MHIHRLILISVCTLLFSRMSPLQQSSSVSLMPQPQPQQQSLQQQHSETPPPPPPPDWNHPVTLLHEFLRHQQKEDDPDTILTVTASLLGESLTTAALQLVDQCGSTFTKVVVGSDDETPRRSVYLVQGSRPQDVYMTFWSTTDDDLPTCSFGYCSCRAYATGNHPSMICKHLLALTLLSHLETDGAIPVIKVATEAEFGRIVLDRTLPSSGTV